MSYTKKQLHELFKYNQDTGKVFWKECPDWLYDNVKAIKTHNTMYCGKEVTRTDKIGQYRVSIRYKTMQLSHIIWKMVYDEWPSYIKHIDGNVQNNKISNLRDRKCLQNMKL